MVMCTVDLTRDTSKYDEQIPGLLRYSKYEQSSSNNLTKQNLVCARQKPGLGTQRISAPAPAKQAARKVASAGNKVFGTQKTPAPVKQVKKAASKVQAAAKPAGGLFGTRKVAPSSGAPCKSVQCFFVCRPI